MDAYWKKGDLGWCFGCTEVDGYMIYYEIITMNSVCYVKLFRGDPDTWSGGL